MNLPEIVSEEEWSAARERILAREKELMRAADELAAERRRAPMTEVTKDYVFTAPDGSEARLLDLFEGLSQLALYHFMLGPSQDEGCDGCSMVVDNFGHPAHLRARDTNLVLVSRAPQEKIQPFRERMGWELPWYSSAGSDFNHDFGVGPAEPDPGSYQDGESFGLSIFLRDRDRVFRTYFTDRRGIEAVSSNWAILDRTPFGRQEAWEDTPEDRPQGEPFSWWRLHDSYD